MTDKIDGISRSILPASAIIATSALALAGLQSSAVLAASVADDSRLLVAEAPVGCEEGRGLMLLDYWKFLNSHPECTPGLDDENFYTEVLVPGETSSCARNSGYGSKGRRCNSRRSHG